MSIVPLPSELAESVNSFIQVLESVLTRLMAAVLLGRDHAYCTRSKFPGKGSLKCHGMWVPRKERRCLSPRRKSSRRVSLRRSDQVRWLAIQLAVPCWKPGVGMGEEFRRA